MFRFRFLLIAAAFLAAAPLFVEAQTESASPSKTASGKVTAVPFRAGTILSAEISRQKPQFDVESQFDFPAIDNPAWVELIVKLDQGRSISRFDYELVGAQNDVYSCFAVAEGADGYSVDADKWTIQKPHPLKYYRLLFPVKQSELASASKELVPMTLKLKLYKTIQDPATFDVRVMPQGSNFTRVSSIRPEGLCNMNYHEAFESGK